jgi:hypothetical protein
MRGGAAWTQSTRSIRKREESGDSPALLDENVFDDAEAQVASQVGERGDEFEGRAAESLKCATLRYRLKPVRVEEGGAVPPCGMLVVTQ